VAARSHRDRGAEVIVLQGGVGGRIYERTADGVEHEWGEVTAWQPPTRLSYLWYWAVIAPPAGTARYCHRPRPAGTMCE
jgi:hypothetical protein